MKSVLHGTWVLGAQGVADSAFFVWAERSAPTPKESNAGRRILRHPYAATALEIAELLSGYVADVDWRQFKRLTRITILPSTDRAPLAPRWLLDEPAPNDGAPISLRPWRTEGLGLSVLQILDVLVALPLDDQSVPSTRRLGPDLRYWGLVAKFALELLARERYVPGLVMGESGAVARWQPLAEAADERARLMQLAQGMPQACRAVFNERSDMEAVEPHAPYAVLQSFLDEAVDSAVRAWAREPAASLDRPAGAGSAFGRSNGDVSQLWWRALQGEEREIKLPAAKGPDLTRFYQAWQSWTYRARPETGAPFRICFRLEPPDVENLAAAGANWTLRYFLQAADDPSLLVPAREVWRERGDVLSYLNRRFDHPQERLLEGLGMASGICNPIRRSLVSQTPEAVTLTDHEAFTFLRETARLLEGAGFGVMVPPWWNRPDARLRVRAKLQVSPDSIASGMLGMASLVDYNWELALGDDVLTREEFDRLAALKAPLVQVRGRWVLLQPDQVEAAIAFWERHRNQEQITVGNALGIALGADDDLQGLGLEDISLDDHLTSLFDALAGRDELAVLNPPQGLEGELRPYQVLGYSWLMFLRKWGFGACLADDMGLGKTIQAIALMLETRTNGANPAPSLVICPTSVVGNWRREVERFAPELRVLVHHGAGRAEGKEFAERSGAADLVISTYGLVRRDINDLRRVHWANVILDEAQNIKNPVTKQARATRRLLGDYRVALTGTPVENRLSELWSIMAFLNPGYLGSLDSFRRNLALPIERYQDVEAQERLRRLVRPFILRRLKTDPNVIRDLPDKFEYKVYCNLTREQVTLYEAVVQDAMRALQEGGDLSGIRRRGMVLAMLTRLKQICDHPALFLGDRSVIGARSGKLNRLSEMLEEVLAVGDRALVFTQFAQMGHLLQRHLQDTFGQEVLFLHGGTPQTQRDAMVQRFTNDEAAPSIFVLSLKAGGTGLNLMRANHVFHFDRWWNPAVENQATDRAYRIGQARDVQVHKYISVGTLEERIDALIESKRELAESVVGTGEGWLTELSTEELRDLITLRAEAVEAD
jgi:SNF2 family DNA or RNA helicase